MSDWPGEEALWRSVAATLSDEVIPAMRPGPAQAVARQLMGLALYALHRGADPGPDRSLRLGQVLGVTDAAWGPLADKAAELLTSDRGGGSEPDRAAAVRGLLVEFMRADQEIAAPLLETFARHGTSLVEQDHEEPPESARLRDWLEAQIGSPIVGFSAAVMSGGHSRRMLDVKAQTATDQLSLVVRIEQGGVFGTEGTSEGRLMQALGQAGVPVAPIRWIEPTGTALGQPFFVMDRVAGTDEIDEISLRGFGRSLLQLHHLDPSKVSAALDVVPSSPDDGVQLAIRRWESVYEQATDVRVPLLDDVSAWLRHNLRPTGPVAVVHGDPGPGNFLHVEGEVTALTDWEFAHLGDPAEDWVYLAALRGVRVMDLPGWVDWLDREVDIRYDDEQWKSWTVFNCFKGACANLTALRVFNRGVTTGPNLLAVGTAVHLRLLSRAVEMIG